MFIAVVGRKPDLFILKAIYTGCGAKHNMGSKIHLRVDGCHPHLFLLQLMCSHFRDGKQNRIGGNGTRLSSNVIILLLPSFLSADVSLMCCRRNSSPGSSEVRGCQHRAQLTAWKPGCSCKDPGTTELFLHMGARDRPCLHRMHTCTLFCRALRVGADVLWITQKSGLNDVRNERQVSKTECVL